MIIAHIWFWRLLAGVLSVVVVFLLSRTRRSRGLARHAAFELPRQSEEAEDALKAAYVLQRAGNLTDERLAGSLGLPSAMADTVTAALVASGWAEKDRSNGLRLKQAGEMRAVELIRAHRLWERYLVEKTGASLDSVHIEAERREHDITPDELRKLDADLGYPALDPHGHFIPDPGRQEPPAAGRPLSGDEQPGSRFRIVSLIEDPAALLAQLVALGLKPGVNVEVAEQGPAILQLRVNKGIVPLARAAARHVSVVPAPVLPVPLGELSVGTQAYVVEITGEGKHQRRMLDFGFVPGAELMVIRKAPLGDPVEYRVKGTNVALRRAEADSILVEEPRSG